MGQNIYQLWQPPMVPPTPFYREAACLNTLPQLFLYCANIADMKIGHFYNSNDIIQLATNFLKPETCYTFWY